MNTQEATKALGPFDTFVDDRATFRTERSKDVVVIVFVSSDDTYEIVGYDSLSRDMSEGEAAKLRARNFILAGGLKHKKLQGAGNALNHKLDTIKEEPPEYGYKHTHEVTFRASPTDIVINITIDLNARTYKVTASACIPTAMFLEYTAAYSRAREFVIYMGLQPKP